MVGMDAVLVVGFLVVCATVGWFVGPKVYQEVRSKRTERTRWS